MAAATAATPATPSMIRRQLRLLRAPTSRSKEAEEGRGACTSIAWCAVEMLVDWPVPRTSEVFPSKALTFIAPPIQEMMLSPLVCNRMIAAACGASGAARTT
jgi:hypothetical protein